VGEGKQEGAVNDELHGVYPKQISNPQRQHEGIKSFERFDALHEASWV